MERKRRKLNHAKSLAKKNRIHVSSHNKNIISE